MRCQTMLLSVHMALNTYIIIVYILTWAVVVGFLLLNLDMIALVNV